MRTFFIIDKGDKLEIKVTNLTLLRLFLIIWFSALTIIPILNIWLKHTNFSSEKTVFIIYAFVFGVTFLGFVFVGILKASQVVISLENAELFIDKQKYRKWPLSDIKNISCQNRSVVLETSQTKQVIIDKKMGYSKKKLLLLANYLNDKIREHKKM